MKSSVKKIQMVSIRYRMIALPMENKIKVEKTTTIPLHIWEVDLQAEESESKRRSKMVE